MFDPRRGRLDPSESDTYNRKCQRDVQERIRLFISQYLLHAVIAFAPFLLIECPPTFLKKPVYPAVFVGDKVQLFGTGFRGVPDIILVWVLRDVPAHQYGIEVPGIDIVRKERGPLENTDFHVDPDLLQPVLDYLGGLYPLFVPLIGKDGKTERFPVLHKWSFSSGPSPAGLGEKLFSPFGIVGKRS